MVLQDLQPLFKNEINIEEISRINDLFCKTLMFYRLKCMTPFKKEGDDSPFNIYRNEYEHDLTYLTNGIVICSESSQIDLIKHTYQKDISYFFNQKFGKAQMFSVYVDGESRRTIITCDDLNMVNSTFYRILALTLPRLLPWYLDKVSQEIKIEIAKLSDDYRLEEIIQKKLEQEINDSGIHQEVMMGKIMSSYESFTNQKIHNAKASINTISDKIKASIHSISIMSEEIRNLKSQIQAFEINSEEAKKPLTDLLDFLKVTNEQIEIIKVDGLKIFLSIRAAMSEWENSEYQAYVLNNAHLDSYFFKSAPGGLSNDELKLLYKAIFDTRKLTVFFGTQIYVNISTGELNSCEYKEWNHCMRHPHLNNDYFCTGNNSEFIAQYISEYRLVEAINCIIYMSKQFTIGDSTIGQLFIEDLFECECIELPNGEYANAYDAITYIKDHKEEFEDD